MKKFILSALLFLLVGSCGGAIAATVHADTLTPSESAALGQSLQAMKAELLNLQTQAAAQAPSSDDLAAATTALQALSSALGELSQTIATNPASLTETNRLALNLILDHVSVSLLTIDQSLATPAAGASAIATAMPPATSNSAAVSAPKQPVQSNGAVSAISMPKTGSKEQSNAPAAPQTAQLLWNLPLSRGWMATIGIVALLLIILLVRRSRTNKKMHGKPVKQPIFASSTAKPASAAFPVKAPMETKIAVPIATPPPAGNPGNVRS